LTYPLLPFTGKKWPTCGPTPLVRDLNGLSTAPDPNQVAQLQSEISARDAKIQDLENQLRQPAPGQPPQASRGNGEGGDMNGLSGIEVTRDEVAGTVTVRVPGDVLTNSSAGKNVSSRTGKVDRSGTRTVAFGLSPDLADGRRRPELRVAGGIPVAKDGFLRCHRPCV